MDILCKLNLLRTSISYPLKDLNRSKSALLEWSKGFKEIAWLDSNSHHDAYGSFEALLAVEAESSITVRRTTRAFEKLKKYRAKTKDWIFGYLSYDLKNSVENLSSTNFDGLLFPNLFFFRPKKIIRIRKTHIEFMYLEQYKDDITSDYKAIFHKSDQAHRPEAHLRVAHIKMRIFKDEYFSRANRMLAHIQRGDIYEANFCQEFYAEDTEIDPHLVYQKLNSVSKAPFATFFRNNNYYLISASPERYLQKKGHVIVSQPIKGTAKRSADPMQDSMLAQDLQNDIKERAENIMIVDLVRNDLSKNALKGTVQVSTLCEVKTYEQVHQMVSTISAEVPSDKNPVDLIKESFPMGSMTGAPKISAMKIIEELESFKRGLYSGAVGYFTPKGDFDFNVVIRSILYNSKKKYVSFSVGSALTAKAKAEKEYEECLLKAKAMREVLESVS